MKPQHPPFSATRLWGIVVKEFIQMRRDRLTFAMMLGIPVMQLLLFGFMFPFRGMPHWAQAIGEVLPLTHFLRIVRGILLKGNALPDVARDLWPIVLFAAVMLTIGIKRYRQTLD